jgi:hypothetical protein
MYATGEVPNPVLWYMDEGTDEFCCPESAICSFNASLKSSSCTNLHGCHLHECTAVLPSAMPIFTHYLSWHSAQKSCPRQCDKPCTHVCCIGCSDDYSKPLPGDLHAMLCVKTALKPSTSHRSKLRAISCRWLVVPSARRDVSSDQAGSGSSAAPIHQDGSSSSDAPSHLSGSGSSVALSHLAGAGSSDASSHEIAHQMSTAGLTTFW